jgi:hypothetical protein
LGLAERYLVVKNETKEIEVDAAEGQKREGQAHTIIGDEW